MGIKLRAANRHLTRLFFTALLAAAGCATPPSDPAARAQFEATNDPLEPLNREIFGFNQFADRVAVKPTAEGYRAVLPEGARNSVRHFLDNLREPIVFANNLLQGQFGRANITAGRFLMNSTFGFGGLFDPATGAALPQQTGDFGQTFYVWGAPDGPYLVLPLLGPSDLRDAVGIGVGFEADPFSWLASAYSYSAVTYARAVVAGIDLRSRNIETLDELQRNSLDFYAQLRSLWRQRRSNELTQGAPQPIPGLDTNPPKDDSDRP